MVIKEVKDTPSFMNCWRNCGINQETSGFKSWKDVEERFKFKFILGTSIHNSHVEFESEEAYTMFLLKWT